MLEGHVGFARQPIRRINRLTQADHDWHEWLLRPILDGESVKPFDLVCAAEQARCATDLDLLIHRRALGFLEAFPDCGTVNLNVSARTVSHQRGVDGLLTLIRGFKNPGQLVFEITETACLRNASEAARFCIGLREMGGRIALDDVSNSHGAIELVNQDWIDIVKISIVNVDVSEICREFERIVESAQSRGQKVIAEGVECGSQLECVRAMGVRFVQGFIDDGAPKMLCVEDVKYRGTRAAHQCAAI